MSPEDRLCQRVMQLSCSTGVSPAVSAALGSAVARYRSQRLGRQGRWWAAFGAVTALSTTGWLGWRGLHALYRMEMERGVEPLFAVAWGLLGIAELTGAIWFVSLARRMFRNWQHFRRDP